MNDKLLPIKRLKLNHAYNVRDMGGFESSNGTITAWNTLYRADALYGLDDSDWKRLEDARVRTIVDLRSLSERTEYIETPPNIIENIHCPLQNTEYESDNIEESAKKAFEKSLSAGYCSMVVDTPELLVKALKTVTTHLSKGAVLFHCAAGKDRTGVLAAVILELAGVQREDIIADYEVSYTYNYKGLFRYIKNEADFEIMKPFLLSNQDTLNPLFECFDKINLSNFLHEHGFTKTEQQTLINAVQQKI